MYLRILYCAVLLALSYVSGLRADADLPSRVGPVAGVTPHEYAVFSRFVYNARDLLLPDGWRIFKSYITPLSCWDSHPFTDLTNAECSYRGEAYIKGEQIVVAHRGTNNVRDFWEDVTKLLPGGRTSYYSVAKNFVSLELQAEINKRCPQCKVIAHTGHSLGGHVAELMAAYYKLPAVTFDSPGSYTVIKANIGKRFMLTMAELSKLVTTYNAAPNLVNTMDYHVGPVTRLYSPYYDLDNSPTSFSLQQHGMFNLVQQFNATSGEPILQGNMTELWPFSNGWPRTSGGGPYFDWSRFNLDWTYSEAYFKKYDANPYYWETYFNHKGEFNRVFGTSSRVKYINDELHGIGCYPTKKGVTIEGLLYGNYLISGATNYNDKIMSGRGDNTIYTFGGNDFVHDLEGNDEYVFYVHNMDGTTTIQDDDGRGKLYVANINCSIAGSKFPKTADGFVFNPSTVKQCEVNRFSRCWKEKEEPCYDHRADIAFLKRINNNKDLQISYTTKADACLKSKLKKIGGTIILKNFKNGHLGISLNDGHDNEIRSNLDSSIDYHIGTDEPDTLFCNTDTPASLYGFGGDDVYKFYYDIDQDCTLNGYPDGRKNFTATSIWQLKNANGGSEKISKVNIREFKPGDLLDLSALKIGWENIKYRVVNWTSIFEFDLPHRLEIAITGAMRSIGVTFDGQTVENPLDQPKFENITLPHVPDDELFIEPVECPRKPVMNVKNLDGKNGLAIRSVNDPDVGGINTMGDVNGDGLGDMLFAIASTPRTKFYLIYGSDRGVDPVLVLDDLNSKELVTIHDDLGNPSTFSFGIVGDVNGDGYDDIQLGTDGRDNIRSCIIFGKKDLSPDVYLSQLDGSNGFYIRSSYPGWETGKGSIGDINGDGLADISLLFNNGNQPIDKVVASVVFGRHKFPKIVDVNDLDGKNGFRIRYSYRPNTTSASYTAGDINGDGIDDLFLGMNYGDVKLLAFVIFGAPEFQATVDLANPQPNSTVKFISEKTFSTSGTAGGGKIGDFNNDGIDDLFIGHPTSQHFVNAYIIFGKHGFSGELNVDQVDGSDGIKITGFPPYAHFGFSMSYAASASGNLKDDFVVGAYGENGSRGAVYIFHNLGKTEFPAVLDKRYGLNQGDVTVIQGAKLGKPIGWWAVGGTDINGDGIDDVAIASAGRNAWDNGLYVVFGQPLCAEDEDKESTPLPDDPPEIKQPNNVIAKKNEDGSLTWRCDPRYNNVFYLEHDKPFIAKRIKYKYGAIAWKAYGDSSPAYDTPCPNKHDYPYHILMGQLGDTLWSPCVTPSEASAPVRGPVKWAVQDDLYDDNRGYFDVTVMNYE